MQNEFLLCRLDYWITRPVILEAVLLTDDHHQSLPIGILKYPKAPRLKPGHCLSDTMAERKDFISQVQCAACHDARSVQKGTYSAARHVACASARPRVVIFRLTARIFSKHSSQPFGYTADMRLGVKGGVKS